MLVLSTLAILFLATLVHSTLGFGTALVAMPLLALTIGVQTATPLVAFVIVTTTTVIAWRSWRQVDLRVAWQLLLSSLVGIPVGLWILMTAPERWVTGILGVALILFGLYNLLRPRLMGIEGRAWAYLFGFLAGVLGGAYNTNAPPLVLYGALRRWSPATFRATLQGYFVPAGVLVWGAHGLAGLWTTRVVELYLLALPVVLVGIFAGIHLHRLIPAHRFEPFLYGCLVGLGLLLLL